MDEKVKKVWEKCHGNKQKAYDYAGREIAKAAYGQETSDYRWDIDHVKPRSKGGSSKVCNLVASHVDTNREKADKFPSWKANGATFEAVSTGNDCYKIVKKK